MNSMTIFYYRRHNICRNCINRPCTYTATTPRLSYSIYTPSPRLIPLRISPVRCTVYTASTYKNHSVSCPCSLRLTLKSVTFARHFPLFTIMDHTQVCVVVLDLPLIPRKLWNEWPAECIGLKHSLVRTKYTNLTFSYPLNASGDSIFIM